MRMCMRMKRTNERTDGRTDGRTQAWDWDNPPLPPRMPSKSRQKLEHERVNAIANKGAAKDLLLNI